MRTITRPNALLRNRAWDSLNQWNYFAPEATDLLSLRKSQYRRGLTAAILGMTEKAARQGARSNKSVLLEPVE